MKVKHKFKKKIIFGFRFIRIKKCFIYSFLRKIVVVICFCRIFFQLITFLKVKHKIILGFNKFIKNCLKYYFVEFFFS